LKENANFASIKRGYELESILFYPEICTEAKKKISSTTELIEISATVFQKLAYHDTTGYFSDSQNKITTVI
jgi:TrmH family RNA methyltransferase